MANTFVMLLVVLPIIVLVLGGILYLFVLLCRALKKYISSTDSRQDAAIIKKSLGEVLKNYRTENKMTQEFVAEVVGVSRQPVSKWEQGISDPSTSNLFALAKLFGVTVEELLKEVE